MGWVRDSLIKFGFMKALLLIWLCVLMTMIVIWGLVQPDKVTSAVLTICTTVLGFIGTIVAAIWKQ